MQVKEDVDEDDDFAKILPISSSHYSTSQDTRSNAPENDESPAGASGNPQASQEARVLNSNSNILIPIQDQIKGISNPDLTKCSNTNTTFKTTINNNNKIENQTNSENLQGRQTGSAQSIPQLLMESGQGHNLTRENREARREIVRTSNQDPSSIDEEYSMRKEHENDIPAEK